jgi:transcription antitermination protein NusB
MARAEGGGAPRREGRGSRRRSRELALQALYQWLVSGNDAESLLRQAEDNADYSRSDSAYFVALLEGVIERAADLNAALQPFLDRPAVSLSPVEHALLLMGGYELTVVREVPYRVVINEAVELAKSYGGTDGHKYVNGVLDKLAAQVRPDEVRR